MSALAINIHFFLIEQYYFLLDTNKDMNATLAFKDLHSKMQYFLFRRKKEINNKEIKWTFIIIFILYAYQQFNIGCIKFIIIIFIIFL